MRSAYPCLLVLSVGLPLWALGGDVDQLPPRVTEFLDLNCYECHNGVDKKGDLDLEALDFNPRDPATMELWAFLHDRVRDGEMPPPEESLVEAAERTAFLDEFEAVLNRISGDRLLAEGRVRLRRLSRVEFENTIHDLLGVRIPLLELLPEDLHIDGFSNIAAGQQVSYHLLQKYLRVVDLMLEHSFERAISPPPLAEEPLSMEMQPTVIDSAFGSIFHWEGKKLFHTGKNKTYRYTKGEWVDMNSPLDLEGTMARNAEIMKIMAQGPFKRVYGPRELGVGVERIQNERQGIYHDGFVYSFPTTQGFHGRMAGTIVPETGWYRLKVRAKAHNPPPGRNVWGRIHTGILRAKAPAVYWVGKFEATREVKEFVFDAWIRKDHIIGIQPIDKTIDWANANQIADMSVLHDGTSGIAVQSLSLERIFPGLGAPELKRRLFGNLTIRDGELQSEHPEQDLRDLMKRFGERAFRREVEPSDLNPYVQFALETLEFTGSLLQAVRAGYRAILSSHRFIYFSEDPGKLDDYSVASRLSYFLWSTMPDEELLEIARKGRLTQPAVLRDQVERMLNDPKADAFVRNFTDSWLNLRDINFTTPDARLYPEFDNILLHSMLDETRDFLRHMIERNLSVSHVIDSDFTIVNERMAKHYGMEFGTQTGSRTTPLHPQHRRGGIITHASVLKVTANGTTTSPIIRGVWLMERILGKHIPPPPDQVPAIEPDIRGVTSVRELLDKHRSIESCMACHKKIDPPGFALENYDVIGGWRENYRAIKPKGKWNPGPAVDASYHFADGRSFQDVEGFKALVLSDMEQIASNMVKQVLTYATGAEIAFADRREIKEMVEALGEEGYGFRSLIHAVTQSDIFLSK